MTSDNNSASRFFTSVCFSADGTCVLAGGNSKYVCIYEVSQQMLLKKFQVSFNRALDGVLDELNSKNLGDGGPIDAIGPDEAIMDKSGPSSFRLPGAKQVTDAGSRKHRTEVLTTQVSFSPTGRDWAAISGEGLHIYSLDDDMLFDPIALTEAITPAAVQSNLRAHKYSVALLMSMHLNEATLVQQVLDATPYASITHVVRSVKPEHLERLMNFIANTMIDSPHLEFYLQWCLELLKTHGIYLQKHRQKYMRAFRTMSKILQTKFDEWRTLCDHNRYTLDFVLDQGYLLGFESHNMDQSHTINK
jgi:periodic tryptophan protein 2